MRSPRHRRPTRRREDVSPPLAVARGITVVVLILAAAFMVLRASGGLPLVSHYELDVILDDAGSLRADSRVDIAGVRVGRVLGKSSAEGGRARVRIQLDEDVEPLPVDTSAEVRAQGLLGARFLELVPGSERETLASGDTVRGGAITNGVPEALRAFDERTREALGENFATLGHGLAGRGEQVNEAMAAAPALAGDLETAAEAVLARPGAADRLLPSLAEGAGALDSAGEDMARGAGPGAKALKPFIDHRVQAQAALDEAPGALSAAEAGFSEGRRLLRATRELATAATETLPPAPAGLAEAEALLRRGRDPLRRATPLLRAAGETVPSVLTIARRLDPVIDPALRALADLRPTVREVGRRRCDLDNFAENWRSMLGYGVRGGGGIGPLNSIRIEVIGSNESIVGLGPDAKDLVLPNGFVVRNPYPEPCEYSPGTVYAEDRIQGGTAR